MPGENSALHHKNNLDIIKNNTIILNCITFHSIIVNISVFHSLIRNELVHPIFVLCFLFTALWF